MDTPGQRLERMGDYLRALTRHGGAVGPAKREVGISQNRLASWRHAVPEFGVAERAVIALAASDKTAPRSRVTETMLDRAAELMHKGASTQDAARKVGLSASTLYRYAATHTALAEQISSRRIPALAGKGPTSKLDDETASRMRAMWPKETMRIADMAQEFNVHAGTILNWARDLGLPSRRTRRADRLKMTAAKLAEARRLLDGGASRRQAAAAVGVSATTLNNHLRS